MNNNITIGLSRHRVWIFVGPYNTICRSIDAWKVKQLLNELVEASKKRCPTCNQEVQ